MNLAIQNFRKREEFMLELHHRKELWINL